MSDHNGLIITPVRNGLTLINVDWNVLAAVEAEAETEDDNAEMPAIEFHLDTWLPKDSKYSLVEFAAACDEASAMLDTVITELVEQYPDIEFVQVL